MAERTTHRWVYGFDELDDAEAAVGGPDGDIRGLLGGKGANLAEMTRLGLPIPPGFIITSEACNAHLQAHGTPPADLWPQVEAAVSRMEEATGKRFGDPSNPLLVACRSGAKFSMPGMMDTVLDIGLNHEVVTGMIAATGNPHVVHDSYRRLLQMFGSVVLGVDTEWFEEVLTDARVRAGVTSDADLDADALADVSAAFEAVIARRSTRPFPTDPRDQLRMAIEAVFESWDGKRARDYRRASGIPDDLGTAVNVVTMVFGNSGPDSGTGVAMSRNATTGDPTLEGDFLLDAQGEDVVAGIRLTRPIAELSDVMPEIADEFASIAKRLELHYRDMQDMEFTIENGRLWMLQTRDGKRTAQAAVRIAVDLANEGVISKEEAIERVSTEQVESFLHPRFDPAARAASTTIATGLNVSPGAATGVVALDPDLAERWAHDGRDVILVRHETKPDDVHGMLAARGILTSSGGRTSHAALVARQFGRPAVVGASDLVIDLAGRSVRTQQGSDEWTIDEGEWISIDGTTGEVFPGKVDRIDPDLDDPYLQTLLDWADDLATIGVRANADTGPDADRAFSFGAKGIGLCRTEHMFFATDRLPIVQRMILADTAVERDEAIESLLPFQKSDFADLFRAMKGRPVMIRLLDPPLHEFLPDRDELVRDITDLQIRLGRAPDLVTVESLVAELGRANTLLRQVDARREANSMLGTRGVRVGLLLPALSAMQVRAIYEAALDVAEEGIEVNPEVLIPLVCDTEEFVRQRRVIAGAAKAVFDHRGRSLPVHVGAMIEVPRAALLAAEIGAFADFVSFGTNDLTQTTFGMSRDDAEAGFLLEYLAEGVLTENPFATLDRAGVGRLIDLTISSIRATKPDFEAGICGEHGGDPRSIAIARDLGVSYVSCSPYRVPVARLAAARVELARNDAEPIDLATSSEAPSDTNPPTTATDSAPAEREEFAR